MYRLALILLIGISSNCATARPSTDRPWCEDRTGVAANDWAELTDFAILPVRSDRMQFARERLSNARAIRLSNEAADELKDGRLEGGFQATYLIRSGILLEPGRNIQEVNENTVDPDNYAIYWSQSLLAVALVYVTSVAEHPVYYDVPLLLATNAPVETAYVNCVAAIHPVNQATASVRRVH